MHDPSHIFFSVHEILKNTFLYNKDDMWNSLFQKNLGGKKNKKAGFFFKILKTAETKWENLLKRECFLSASLKTVKDLECFNNEKCWFGNKKWKFFSDYV